MNYQVAYDNLIRTRKQRVPVKGAYYENHHIVMKSMGGSDEPENLVRLTAREHFLAHWLLWRIHGNRQTASAFGILRKQCLKQRKSHQYTPSSRAYQEAKEAADAGWKMWNFSPEGIASRYRKHSEATKEKIRQASLKRDFSEVNYVKALSRGLTKRWENWRKTPPKVKRLIEIDNVLFQDLTDASAKLGISKQTIWKRCTLYAKNFPSYKIVQLS